VKEDPYVLIKNNLLTIRGVRKLSEETKKDNYHNVERSYGEFIRSFTITSFVKANNVNAEFKDGAQRAPLAKSKESKPKRIEVTVK
jgi:HSP20 family protein